MIQLTVTKYLVVVNAVTDEYGCESGCGDTVNGNEVLGGCECGDR